jgi:hypothetical protein
VLFAIGSARWSNGRQTYARPPSVVDEKVNVDTLACGSSFGVGFRHIQTNPSHPIERDAFWVSCRRIDLSRPGSEQFLRKCQTETSVCACYERN